MAAGFMEVEVDGVVSDIVGEDAAIQIKHRNLGDISLNTNKSGNGADNMGNEISGTEKVVIDPKRHRVENELESVDNGPNGMMTDGLSNITGDLQDQEKITPDPEKLDCGGLWTLDPPNIMSLIAWNFRGLANLRTVSFYEKS